MALLGLTEAVPTRGLVRPPGVVSEEQFLRDCLRCGACVDVCPVHGLSFADAGDGFRNIGTPKLAGYCMVFRGLESPSSVTGMAWKENQERHRQSEACLECIKACPSGALQPVDVSHLHLGTAVVHRDLCWAWRYGSCGFPCVGACPFDAISVNAGPEVDEEKCVGCNQCAFVCLARQTGPTAISVEWSPR